VTAAESSILVSSTPASGATVTGPVEELTLRFNPPARLDELTVSGPDGLMPMKVASVGESDRYSVPVSVTAPGPYAVTWRATAGGVAHRGSFSFVVK